MVKHAKLSPSSSGRWLHCAGSLTANAQAGRGSSVYADQGTAAAALLEVCNRIGQDPEKFMGKAIYKEHIVDDDMCEAVGHALDYIRSYMATHPGTKLYCEEEVDPAALLKCLKGEASGTPDVVLDNPRDLELIVLDYKHGAGVSVEVDGNTQILQYFVGHVSQHLTRAYKTYRGVIVQPRDRHVDGPVREVVYTHEEIMAHAKRLRQRIIEIAKHPEDRNAGKWCKWCAAEGTCKTLAAAAMQAASLEFGKELTMQDPKDMTVKERAEFLRKAPMIESCIEAVRTAALKDMLANKKIPGWKLVYGKTSRFWQDARAAAKWLISKGFKPEDISKPRAFFGVPDVERLLKARKMLIITGKGKDRKVELPPALLRAVGRTMPPVHIAPEDDARQAIQRGAEFKGK